MSDKMSITKSLQDNFEKRSLSSQGISNYEDSSDEDKEEVWNNVKKEIEGQNLSEKECIKQLGFGQLAVVALRTRCDDIEQPQVNHVMTEKEKSNHEKELKRRI